MLPARERETLHNINLCVTSSIARAAVRGKRRRRKSVTGDLFRGSSLRRVKPGVGNKLWQISHIANKIEDTKHRSFVSLLVLEKRFC